MMLNCNKKITEIMLTIHELEEQKKVKADPVFVRETDYEKKNSQLCLALYKCMWLIFTHP